MARGLIAGEPQVSSKNKTSRASPIHRHSPVHAAPCGNSLQPLLFREVNQRGAHDYDPGLQRHHLLPLQLLTRRCFARLFDAIGQRRMGFDDFRRNGLLLPCNGRTAVLMGLPLHRGPHHRYNGLVIERVGQIEARWTIDETRNSDRARTEALFRLGLLQSALRRRLLDPRGRHFTLNASDPALRLVPDFSHIDAMAETLWAATRDNQPVYGAEFPAKAAFAATYSAASLSTRSATLSTESTAPMPCPQPQISFQALASELPPEPKSIALGSLPGKLSGSMPDAAIDARR